MQQAFGEPPVNKAMNPNTTTVVSFRVGAIYAPTPANGAVGAVTSRVIDTVEAVRRVTNATTLVAACAASLDCRTRWNIEGVATQEAEGADTGMPWWILLLIVLAAVAFCIICWLCLSPGEEKEEDGSRFVTESDGHINYVGNSVPDYAIRGGSMEPTAETARLTAEEEQDEFRDADHDRDSQQKISGMVPAERQSRITPV